MMVNTGSHCRSYRSGDNRTGGTPYVSHARRALGTHRLPAANEHGYQLVDIDCDWTTFQTLTNHASTLPPHDARTALTDAIALVRGPALPDPPRWAQTENLPAVIDRAVTTAAATLARLHLDTGNAQAALAAAETGLALTPTDPACAQTALTAAATTGHLPAVWQRIQTSWTDADLTIPPSLIDLRHQLAHPAR